MAVDLRERIIEYMERCRLCTVATASADGQPSASTVFFRTKGLDVYFNTGREAQKVQNILVNPRMAIAMQEAGPVPETDRDIKGIQYIGKAAILSDADAAEVPAAVMTRHHAFNSVRPGNSVIVKVSPERIYLVDYSRGFRHRDVLQC